MHVLKSYHFHLYFLPQDVSLANSVLTKFKQVFTCEVGRVWDKPVGPHPFGSCQIRVPSDQFYEVLEWFLFNRNGLDLFIHPEGEDALKDHTDNAIWVGKSYDLDLSIFSK